MDGDGMTDERHPALAALIASFEARAAASTEPAWLQSLRRDSLARFQALGVPTQKHEDWKYTSLAALGRLELDASPVQAPRFAALLVDCSLRLIFVDGKLEHRSGEAPAGVSIEPIIGSLGDPRLEKPI